ncbi:MAG: hypothetical protein WCZ28_16815 [Burkholderiaceae bacterium]
MTDKNPQDVFGRHLLDDAANRVRWQHEFSLAGIRTLVLINGGAIIALLTYLGQAGTRLSAERLEASFFAYVVGLVATVVAYLLAYYSQGAALNAAFAQAQVLLGLAHDEESIAKLQKGAESALRQGRRLILGAVISAVIGLTGFVIGSGFAMLALN